MYEDRLKDLEKISKEIGKHKDYVQGGGGNTSIKLDKEWMAIKASGYKLDQVISNDGFAVVNYKKVIEYMNNINFNSDIDYETDSVSFIRKNVLELDGIKLLRPSIETGFHSILKKVVIHTHSVYSNIICCCNEGEDLIKEIFRDSNIGYVWIPYIKPGFSLSYYIMNKRKDYKKDLDLIFMENHGLIVNNEDTDKCLNLHNDVNELIKSYFKLPVFPKVELNKIDGDIYKSSNDFILNFIKENRVGSSFFTEFFLYPDQIVYLNEYLNNKIFITDKEVVYKTKKNEALMLEETLLAYFYVIDQINSLKLELKVMPENETDYIKNWEVEKFRRQVSTNEK